VVRRKSRQSPTRARSGPRVLIIVQNLPVPFDRRVWLECQTLTAAGVRVAVVCPKGPGDPGYQRLDGVDIYKYAPHTAGGGTLGYVVEYAYSFLATAALSLWAAREGPFSVVQACNPPDIFWPIGLLFRILSSTDFVFDHHDLCPELFDSRFPDGPRVVRRALLWLERRTFATATRVISTNESYRSRAIGRGGVPPEAVTVVRTGPDPSRLSKGPVEPSRRRGRQHLVAYLGVMGPQDGVDIVLRVADLVVHDHCRRDIAFTLIGSGDCFGALTALRDELGLDDVVEFTGRLPDAEVAAILSSADVGLSPDPSNALNDVSTMNKTMEYMSFELPVVAFDLPETRVSAAGAAVYARPNDVGDYARLLLELLNSPERRREMGRTGRRRVVEELAWEHQAASYRQVYEELLGAGAISPAPQPADAPVATADRSRKDQ